MGNSQRGGGAEHGKKVRATCVKVCKTQLYLPQNLVRRDLRKLDRVSGGEK